MRYSRQSFAVFFLITYAHICVKIDFQWTFSLGYCHVVCIHKQNAATWSALKNKMYGKVYYSKLLRIFALSTLQKIMYGLSRVIVECSCPAHKFGQFTSLSGRNRQKKYTAMWNAFAKHSELSSHNPLSGSLFECQFQLPAVCITTFATTKNGHKLSRDLKLLNCAHRLNTPLISLKFLLNICIEIKFER